MMKKIWAIVLTFMILAMSLSALATGAGATTTLDSQTGEQGAFSNPDRPVVQGKVLLLNKELKVYNADEIEVYAPTITYNYSITPATVTDGTTVTDKSDKHNPAGTVTTPVKAGIGNFTTSVSWANEKVDAAPAGAANMKSISIDFSSAVFTGAGIYRYEISESLANGFTYANTGVTETTATDDVAAHKRYIDVYVKPAADFDDGESANDWDIYGFTCFYNNVSITEADKTTGAVKTTGFTDGATGGSSSENFLADQYYTYNLTISKTVEGDNYAKATHDFPFTVIFTNSDITKNILLKATAGTGVSNYTFLTTAGAPTYNGVMLIKDVDNNNSIKLIGIPMGTDVEVYETNDMPGTTYKVTTTRTNATPDTATDAMVISGTTPTSAVAQAATKADDQSTKSVVDTTKDTKDDNAHTIAITNILVTISPTGVVLRIAPYIMILAAGIVLLLVSRRRKAVQD